VLVYTRCGIERERERGERERRERERGWRGAWEDRGGYQEVLSFKIFLFFIIIIIFIIFFSLFFLFLLHEDQSPGSIHSKDTQMLAARDYSVKIHRQLFVAGI